MPLSHVSTGQLITASTEINPWIDAINAAAVGAWPIGSIFIAAVATNPATLLGFGTWAAYGAGRVLVGFDASQTEFDTLEETGGAKTHTLTVGEMPVHAHPEQYGDAGGATTNFEIATNRSVTQATSPSLTGTTGGGGSHNNLMPYITVHFWRRTA